MGVCYFPTREGTQLRNQLLLNLGLPEVKQFVLDFMTTLLTKYDIRFIKWDMNRTVTEPCTSVSGDTGASMWIKHVDHLYAIWAELRERFPHVESRRAQAVARELILAFCDMQIKHGLVITPMRVTG